MIRLTGTQRELMEILWENGHMTLHALTKAALGNAVTPNRTDAIRVVLLQMVTKGAVSEDATVSPHIYTPIVDRDEVGFESGFVDAARAEGNALLTALTCGMGLPGEVYSEDRGRQIDEKKGTFQRTVTDEARKEAIKEVMAQICRERDEYEAQKAAAKAEEDKKED
ncbi:MAG: BlaI/MecI/CopY family transcriptional regulator [Oscillospiraceae bacterium]|nr:BlaI/MecI/CopY family transcriptional regulator [Oscillospiraceae bacterium]